MTNEELSAALQAPFPADALGWKPQAVKGNKALAVCFIDARTVAARLDEVFGVGGWQDEYTPLDKGLMMCRLSVLVSDRWVVKTDVGGESEQPDAGDRVKAAVSDALKRAAVKLGVGRYLYDLDPQWCDYDAGRRAFTVTPRLPAKYLPKHNETAPRRDQGSAPNPPHQAERPNLEEFKAEWLRTGVTWKQIVSWISGWEKTSYSPEAKYTELPAKSLRMALDNLKGMPTKAAANKITPAEVLEAGGRVFGFGLTDWLDKEFGVLPNAQQQMLAAKTQEELTAILSEINEAAKAPR